MGRGVPEASVDQGGLPGRWGRLLRWRALSSTQAGSPAQTPTAIHRPWPRQPCPVHRSGPRSRVRNPPERTVHGLQSQQPACQGGDDRRAPPPRLRHRVARGADRAADRPHQPPHRAPEGPQEGPSQPARPADAGRVAAAGCSTTSRRTTSSATGRSSPSWVCAANRNAPAETATTRSPFAIPGRMCPSAASGEGRRRASSRDPPLTTGNWRQPASEPSGHRAADCGPGP